MSFQSLPLHPDTIPITVCAQSRTNAQNKLNPLVHTQELLILRV
jgi:hypothetical protein